MDTNLEIVTEAVEPVGDDLAAFKGVLLSVLTCILLWTLLALLPFGVREPWLAVGGGLWVFGIYFMGCRTRRRRPGIPLRGANNKAQARGIRWTNEQHATVK
jgi:hypothetical protein